jgi:hypothetical protein
MGESGIRGLLHKPGRTRFCPHASPLGSANYVCRGGARAAVPRRKESEDRFADSETPLEGGRQAC